MEKQDYRRFFAGSGTIFHGFFCWEKQTDRHFIVSIINLRIQRFVKNPHRIHLFDICQFSGSIYFYSTIRKGMENCPHSTWHNSIPSGRNTGNYDLAASSVFFSGIDIFCFSFILSGNADMFHTGAPVGNPFQNFMIRTDNYFRPLISPDVITVFFLFYTWSSQSQ